MLACAPVSLEDVGQRVNRMSVPSRPFPDGEDDDPLFIQKLLFHAASSILCYVSNIP